MEWIHADSH